MRTTTALRLGVKYAPVKDLRRPARKSGAYSAVRRTRCPPATRPPRRRPFEPLSLAKTPSALLCKDLRHVGRLGPYIRITGFSNWGRSQPASVYQGPTTSQRPSKKTPRLSNSQRSSRLTPTQRPLPRRCSQEGPSTTRRSIGDGSCLPRCVRCPGAVG